MSNEKYDSNSNDSNTGTGSTSWNQKNYPYQVDYNDHFETPLIAYQDVAPLLDWLAKGKTTRKDHKIYDPYYCNGATVKLMKETLGFEGIINQKRDFYQDVKKKR